MTRWCSCSQLACVCGAGICRFQSTVMAQTPEAMPICDVPADHTAHTRQHASVSFVRGDERASASLDRWTAWSRSCCEG